MDVERRQATLDRFERVVEVPLLLLALAMVPLLLAPVVFDLSPRVVAAVEVADWFIWATFAAEYAVRLILAPARRVFVRRAWVDVLIVVLPFLRPLRLARSARVLRGLRLVRVGAVIARRGREARRFFVPAPTAPCAPGRGGLARPRRGARPDGGRRLGARQDRDVRRSVVVVVHDHDDWRGVRLRGPGDLHRRGIATFLMVAGIALFGVLTANVAAFFIEGTTDAQEDRLDEVLRRLDAIEAALRPDP